MFRNAFEKDHSICKKILMESHNKKYICKKGTEESKFCQVQFCKTQKKLKLRTRNYWEEMFVL
jgi:hypothetical protein